MGIILLFVQGLMKIIKESKDFYELGDLSRILLCLVKVT
ncbi:hypothetical protein CDSM653_00408 [Caldanaerobacter subterraneus subsp. pacificus DSM 12653]|uniref:Uncharacterized protein n=1 Tax=Caldanaerobacter subterraneus subsp. pacificus DSM 12653 TaxID=391606 RepID=A0A0F5PPK2_9THEO|nr:hypothetical protein CDSM653_00408 [Caldanaerobacter subterraneus subsp. pacificus DSM 12653]